MNTKYIMLAMLASCLPMFGDLVEENQKLKEEMSVLEKQTGRVQEQLAAVREKTAVLKESSRRILSDQPIVFQNPVETSKTVNVFFTDKALELSRKAGDGPKQAMWETWEKTLTPGREYRFTVSLKAEDVKNVPIKFGLMVPLAEGKKSWPAAQVGTGTFDWRKVSFTYRLPFAANQGVLLMIGVYSTNPSVTGKVFAKDFVIEEIGD